jgi:uncharacterized phage-like protein YoqJ
MEPTSCCFTGHRHIDPALLPHLTAHIDASLRALVQMGCLHFYAGGALGFDTLAAERTLALRQENPQIKLHLLLPCPDQCRGWSREEIDRYESVLSRADSYRYIGNVYSAAAMTKRNRALVANADVCIAFLQKEASGTGQTVRAARQAGLTVINLADRMPLP